jgi:mycoredoxin-dependent peroxiredoxin
LGAVATTSSTVAVGDTAPDFTLVDQHGEPVTLSGLRGHPVVLVFLRGFG